jgi:CheY-like chemotaxis protein
MGRYPSRGWRRRPHCLDPGSSRTQLLPDQGRRDEVTPLRAQTARPSSREVHSGGDRAHNPVRRQNPGCERTASLAPCTPPSQATAGRLCVLLLEDDARVADVMSAALHAGDYDVSRARTVDEAKSLWDERGQCFDVLLCDYELPDGTGIDFLEHVEQSRESLVAEPMRILWSGSDRSEHMGTCGLERERILLKSQIADVLDLIERQANQDHMASTRRPTGRPLP